MSQVPYLPFSKSGSYTAFAFIEGEFHSQNCEKGLYLRTIREAVKSSFIARLEPLENGEKRAYALETSPESLRLQIDAGTVEIAYADRQTILIRGRGHGVGLSLDFTSEERDYNSIQPHLSGEKRHYYANSSKSMTRMMLTVLQGTENIRQLWKFSRAEYSCFDIQESNGEFLLALEEIETDWIDRGINWDFDRAKRQTKAEFEAFCESMPRVPEKYASARRLCAYVNWSSIVAKRGILTRDAMYMSKNWMSNVWSWDHCFNALALAKENPRLAWDQFMIMFDYQSPAGRIPDSINDVQICENFCKPPIHGWTLRQLRARMHLSRGMLEEAYDRLGKWTAWWLNCRDMDGDGLCEYSHGNDSGWDNSTAFMNLPPVTLPDLAAFLILQMDELSEVAALLGRHSDEAIWKTRADAMLAAMLEKLFEDGLPIGFQTATKQRIQSESLILYLPIVLGRRLPEKVRTRMIAVLKSGKFRTKYGFATEAPDSQFYKADGYWRGPIWAPSTMLILNGLWQCGEEDFVRDMAARFCDLVAESGCAENFDALTGAALRDKAYTWTSSVMLLLAENYLLED